MMRWEVTFSIIVMLAVYSPDHGFPLAVNTPVTTVIARRLHCVEWHNTVIARSGPLFMNKLFTSCIRRCLVSRACDWVVVALSVVLLIFSFQFSLLFFNISVASPGSTSSAAYYWLDTHRTLPKIWVGTFLVRNVHFRGRLWIYSNGKMETRHPVEGQFVSEFPLICNHCVVITAWSRKTWKFCEQFLCFWKKNPLWWNFQNSVPKVFTASTGNRRNRALFPGQEKQKISAASQTRYCADRARNLPGPAPNNVLITVLQDSSKSVHFRRSYSRTREHRFSPYSIYVIRPKRSIASGDNAAVADRCHIER